MQARRFGEALLTENQVGGFAEDLAPRRSDQFAQLAGDRLRLVRVRNLLPRGRRIEDQARRRPD
jgi:hypothetical protein